MTEGKMLDQHDGTGFMTIMQEHMNNEKKEKVKKYKILNRYVKKGSTLLVGSSLTEWFPINELQQSLEKRYTIYNRGIAGSITEELLSSMDECIFELEPSKIFISIGTNDMNTPDYQLEKLLTNYDKILSQIKTRLPNCEVYVIAYYPVNSKADLGPASKQIKDMGIFNTRTNDAISVANDEVKALAEKHQYKFINVNQGLADEEGNLKAEFSVDGMHMYANGYSVVLNNLKGYL